MLTMYRKIACKCQPEIEVHRGLHQYRGKKPSQEPEIKSVCTVRGCFAMKIFFFLFRLKRSKYCRQDKFAGNGSKVTNWHFAQKCHEPHQHTYAHTNKMELFIRLTFQTPFYRFLLGNSLSATANSTTDQLAWEGVVLWQNSFCLQWTHKTGMQKVGRTPTELWDETMWHVGRAGDLESEELALIIKNWVVLVLVQNQVKLYRTPIQQSIWRLENGFDG